MSSIERFVTLVRRELGTDDVTIVSDPADAPPASDSLMRIELPGGGVLVVVFAAPREGLDAAQRRLEMLVDSFRTVLEGEPIARIEPANSGGRTTNRPPAAHSLHEELRALAERASAVDAMVIDARSPVVWGAADADRASMETPSAEVVRLDEHRPAGDPRATPPPPDVAPSAPSPSDHAIAAVRALSVLPSLHRGGHLHHSVRAEEFGYIARSFAGIYVLIVVFDAPWDELSAERAIVHSLPIIERLVLALPPLDPSPMAGAAAIRRGRRR